MKILLVAEPEVGHDGKEPRDDGDDACAPNVALHDGGGLCFGNSVAQEKPDGEDVGDPGDPEPNASVGGAADQSTLRRAKAKKATIQRKVVVRKQGVGSAGLPPVEKKAAARRRAMVQAVDTAVPTEKFSWKNRTARQVRKEKRKPISPGRSRKSLRILLGDEDVGCWSVVVTEAEVNCEW